jgi:hypothetical protein
MLNPTNIHYDDWKWIPASWYVKVHTETLRPKTKFGVRLTNCGRCAIAFPLSIQLSITEALNQCPPTQYAACIILNTRK